MAIPRWAQELNEGKSTAPSGSGSIPQWAKELNSSNLSVPRQEEESPQFPPNQGRINKFTLEAQAAKAEADKGLFGRFLREIPGAAKTIEKKTREAAKKINPARQSLELIKRAITSKKESEKPMEFKVGEGLTPEQTIGAQMTLQKNILNQQSDNIARQEKFDESFDKLGKAGTVARLLIPTHPDEIKLQMEQAKTPTGAAVYGALGLLSWTPPGKLGRGAIPAAKRYKNVVSETDDLAEILSTYIPKKKGRMDKVKTLVNRFLDPFKATPELAQNAYKRFVARQLVGQQRATNIATEVAKNVPVSGKAGIDEMIQYQTTGKSKYADKIRATFDNLFTEASKRGLEVPYRQNYLPQVYANTALEVRDAVGKFLIKQGVDPIVVANYIEGSADLPETVSKQFKLNPSFGHERVFHDYATAIEYGLTPRFNSIGQLAGYYVSELERVRAGRKFVEQLIESGQLLNKSKAPNGWKAVDLPLPGPPKFAQPNLAKALNKLYRDEANLELGELLLKGLGTSSKMAQEVALSAGVPKTNVNFFAIGQLFKEITAGNVKNLPAFVRSNFNKNSIEWFTEHDLYIRKMANQGIDMSNRIGTWQNIYQDMSRSKGIWNKVIGKNFDKLFNEKTFASLMPQLQIGTFKRTYQKALRKGMSAAEAEKLAGDVTKNFYGLIDDMGRSRGTKDFLSATFFAPKFRESMIRAIYNTLLAGADVVKSGGGAIKPLDPRLALNRKFLAGAIISYGIYDQLNMRLNGNHMWENEEGRETTLKIPLPDGQIIYVEYLPSVLAFARNMLQGSLAFAVGDDDRAKQKFGSLFSMPIKIGAELAANQDYFGRQIYKDTDPVYIKRLKSAQYAGLAVSHPYITELVKYYQAEPDERTPVYEMVSRAMELPLKFSSEKSVDRQAFYRAIEAQDQNRADTKREFEPTYNKIQELISQGNQSEAMALLNSISEEEYALYKIMKATDKRRSTVRSESDIYGTVLDVQALINAGQRDQAMEIINSLTEEEYKAYKLVKKRLNIKFE